MSENTHIPVSFSLPKTDLAEAVTAALQSRKTGLFEGVEEAIREKDREFRSQADALANRIDGVSSKVDVLSTKVDAAKTKVESELDKMQERVNKNINTYVVPAVIVAFVAIVLGIFAMLGGFKVISDVNTLKASVTTATTDFDKTNATLKTLTTDVNGAAAKLAADRFIEYDKKLNEQNEKIQQLTKQLAAAKASTAVPQTPKPTGAGTSGATQPPRSN